MLNIYSIQTSLGIADIMERLPDNYKLPLEDMVLKQLEYEFHSASYHTLVEIVTGLKNVVGHLIKVCNDIFYTYEKKNKNRCNHVLMYLVKNHNLITNY